MAVTQTPRSGAWRVVELLTTPVVPADYLDVVAPLRNAGVLRARIESVRPETDNAVTLVLRPGRGIRPHLPGQNVRIGEGRFNQLENGIEISKRNIKQVVERIRKRRLDRRELWRCKHHAGENCR